VSNDNITKKFYAVFDGNRIVRTGVCDDYMLADQPEFGSTQQVAEISQPYGPKDLEVVDGVVVVKTVGE
jgi:hypothetical protein